MIFIDMFINYLIFSLIFMFSFPNVQILEVSHALKALNGHGGGFSPPVGDLSPAGSS
jgi:hypothetical protein